jgi:hypothetical protein
MFGKTGLSGPVLPGINPAEHDYYGWFLRFGAMFDFTVLPSGRHED